MGLILDLLRKAALLAALLLPLGPPALGQDSHGAPAAEATHAEPEVPHEDLAHDVAEAEHGAGMPQLDVATFASQIFWLILSFGALYYLLTRKALPRVADILEARQERIAADLDRAAGLREEAEEALRRHEELIAQAHEKAAAEFRATEERLMADLAKRQAQLAAELGDKLGAAEKRITQARDQALAEVQNVAVEVAQAAARRLAKLEVSEAEAKAALDDVLAEAA
jgi:F-type H+-transporting ATPase subunit b